MTTERPEKKSDTIKFRVPWSLKRDFMNRIRKEGRPASEIFREMMEDYLQRPAQRPATQSLETAMKAVRRHPRPAFAAILGAAGISALLSGVIPAGADPGDRAAFDRLDENADGVISLDEYAERGITVPGPEELERLERMRAEAEANANANAERTPAQIAAARERAIESHDGVVVVMTSRADFEPQAAAAAAAAPEPPDKDKIARTTFARIDSSEDGLVSFDEFLEARQRRRDQDFAQFDANGDGVISVDANGLVTEFGQGLSPLEKRFDVSVAMRGLDVNGDGQVSRKEYDDWQERQRRRSAAD